MRPVRLEVEGFTCYRDRQPPLEFSDLTLFAIAGPTGAGKSSILDGVCFEGEPGTVAAEGARTIELARAEGARELDPALAAALGGRIVTDIEEVPLVDHATCAVPEELYERYTADSIAHLRGALGAAV